MATEWHYARDGGQLGPVGFEELRRLASTGRLAADDLVWTEGMPGWEPASEVGGLLPLKPTAWYYTLRGERFGPVSDVELEQLAVAGRLQPSDLVWGEGEPDWRPAAQVAGLIHALQARGVASHPQGLIGRVKEYAASDDAKERLAKARRNFAEVKERVVHSETTKAAVDFAATVPEKWRENSVVLGLPARDWGAIAALLGLVLVLRLTNNAMPPGTLAVYGLCSLWVYRDARTRLNAPALWSFGTLVLGPLVMPFYLAVRNLKHGETREGGTAWNVLRCFALLWTATIAISAFSVLGATSEFAATAKNDLEKVGAAIGAGIGLVFVIALWFVPIVAAVMLGFFLKKSTFVEQGPTGALVNNPPYPPLSKGCTFRDLLNSDITDALRRLPSCRQSRSRSIGPRACRTAGVAPHQGYRGDR